MAETPRTPSQIIDEWREAERDLDGAPDPDTIEDVQAHIARLREEHAAAIEERQDEATELGSFGRAGDGEAAE